MYIQTHIKQHIYIQSSFKHTGYPSRNFFGQTLEKAKYEGANSRLTDCAL